MCLGLAPRLLRLPLAEVVDAAEAYMDLRADRIVQLGGTAEGMIPVATTRTGLEAYPLTRAEERCSMQSITVAEGLTFFFSIAVIVYLWIQ
jgi:DNA-binding ferritin-like protein